MGRMDGKYALITGGASGIGLETARQFIAQGAHVAITGRTRTALERARSELGGQLYIIVSDAGNLADINMVAKQLDEWWPRIDVIFANAGDVTHMPLAEWTEETWDQSMNINLKGPFFLVQALSPLLTDGTSIIFCGSTSAHIAFPHSSVYSAGKLALRALARTLSAELKQRGVRVNMLSPGPTETPALTKGSRSPEAQKQFEDDVRRIVPIGRMGTPWELAQAAVFLGSDESKFIVSTELLVDGGVANL